MWLIPIFCSPGASAHPGFFSLLPEPDFPPALALEIVSRITLANKGGFFIVKSVSKIFDHRKDIEYFKALDLEFAFSPAKLREDQILFHSINDKGTCFQKIHAEQLGMFACIHRNRLTQIGELWMGLNHGEKP